MRFLSLFTLIFIGSISLCSQVLYEQLDYTNYRNHGAFQHIIDPNNFNPEILNACIFFATNEIRAKKKLSILSYHPLLEEASVLHSNDMVELNFFSHVNKKNKKHREPNDRARVVGIENPHLAENIIEGFLILYTSGDEVIPEEPGVFLNPKNHEQLPFHSYISLTDRLMERWMKSKGHRANILSKDAIELGCGSTLYLMHDFNEMPAIKATQSFQWFEKVKVSSE